MKNLQTLPDNCGDLPSLTELELNNLENFFALPEGLGRITTLVKISVCAHSSVSLLIA
jgi:hypothetical protein